MSDQQINIAIAQAVKQANALAGVVATTGEFCTIPDYCNDLDAVDEAVKLVLQNQFNTLYEAYCRNLNHVKPHPIYATARQRAEAFVKTLNLLPQS